MKRKFIVRDILFLLAIIVIIALCMRGVAKGISYVKTNIQERREEKVLKQEQARLDGILEEINNLYLENDNIQTQRKELEDAQTELHNSAEKNREQINTLRNEYYKDKVDTKVMDKICELSPSSPMCGDYTMLIKLKDIADKRKVDYKLLLGIMYAESHIGANFKPTNCGVTNNRAGVKARKYDDGSVSEWFDKQENRVDGCWLYNFDTVEEFFESLANTISIGYGKCNEDPYCIMKYYVGHESGAWVRNVYLFKSL